MHPLQLKRRPAHCHRLAAALISIGLVASATAVAQELAPEIGQRAVPFTLKAHDGRDISLAATLKKGPVVLVFYRSADWCLYCKLQLVQLQENLKTIEAAGGQVLGISHDPPAVLKRFAVRKRIAFPLLSDMDSKTIRAYGMNTPDASERWAGVARHGTFILDQQGIIRHRSFDLSYDDPLAIDALIREINAARKTKGEPVHESPQKGSRPTGASLRKN